MKPNKKYSKKKPIYRKRRFNRKRRPNMGTLHPRTGLPLPTRFFTKMTYALGATGTPVFSVPVSCAQLQLNNLYAPSTGGYNNHQPMGWDQLIKFYQFARVHSCKVTAIFTHGPTSTGTPSIVGMQVHENSAWSPSSVQLIQERGNAVYKPMAAYGGEASKKLVYKWSAKKWYGPTKAKGDTNYCTDSAGPSEVCYLDVFASQPKGNVIDSDGVVVQIIVEYFVEFFGQIQIDAS